MGHYGAKANIVPLIDRLNRYPIGLPDSDKLRRILSILFSDDDAFVASRFPLTEATLGELVRATGWGEDRLQRQLESMADKGLVMDTSYGGKTYYLLMPGLIGFFEFSFMKRRQDLPVAELARLMHEYLYGDDEQKMGREFFASKTPLTRALAYEEHIPVRSQVATYESARQIIKTSSYGAIGMCYCRHKKEHLGESCEKKAPTEEICISLGTAAKFMVRRGFAEQRSKEQLLTILEKARDLNLTHITDNIRGKPSFICNCCSCCCELMGGIQHGFADGIAKAPYTLAIDVEKCQGCGLCAKACNVGCLHAVARENGSRQKMMTVSEAICLGCGACISSCPTGALGLWPVSRPQPPADKKELFVAILKEKRRFYPFVFHTLKARARRLFGRD